MTHEHHKSGTFRRVYLASERLPDRHGADHSAVGARSRTLAQAMAHRTARQPGLRQTVPWPKRLSAWLSGIWLTVLADVQSGGQAWRPHPQGRAFFTGHILAQGEEKIIRDADGKERKSKPFLLRYYRVFNIEQTEGIANKLGLTGASPRVANLEQCDAIVSAMPNPPRREQSARAWYQPSTDTVGIPSRSLFSSVEEYYSTLFHELTHSTGHASRLGREGIEQLNTFGSESYSKEELVAEMGAAMLCGLTGLAPKTLENSAAYLKTWLSVLKPDSRMVVTAASAAQKAVDYIVGKAQGDAQGDGEGCQ